MYVCADPAVLHHCMDHTPRMNSSTPGLLAEHRYAWQTELWRREAVNVVKVGTGRLTHLEAWPGASQPGCMGLLPNASSVGRGGCLWKLVLRHLVPRSARTRVSNCGCLFPCWTVTADYESLPAPVVCRQYQTFDCSSMRIKTAKSVIVVQVVVHAGSPMCKVVKRTGTPSYRSRSRRSLTFSTRC